MFAARPRQNKSLVSSFPLLEDNDDLCVSSCLLLFERSTVALKRDEDELISAHRQTGLLV